jgi:hypothetical protein
MKRFSVAEKTLMIMAVTALAGSLYFLNSDYLWNQKTMRREMPVGQVKQSRGDTRWKGQSQVHHFGTWNEQRLYIGDSLYAGVGSRLAFYVGEVHVNLKPHTRVTLRPVEEKIALEASFGELEIHLPPGARMRLNVAQKYIDLASVNGGRINARIGTDGAINVQNISGDLVVRTEGKIEYTVPEEEFFSAQAH